MTDQEKNYEELRRAVDLFMYDHSGNATVNTGDWSCVLHTASKSDSSLYAGIGALKDIEANDKLTLTAEQIDVLLGLPAHLSNHSMTRRAARKLAPVMQYLSQLYTPPAEQAAAQQSTSSESPEEKALNDAFATFWSKPAKHLPKIVDELQKLMKKSMPNQDLSGLIDLVHEAGNLRLEGVDMARRPTVGGKSTLDAANDQFDEIPFILQTGFMNNQAARDLGRELEEVANAFKEDVLPHYERYIAALNVTPDHIATTAPQNSLKP